MAIGSIRAPSISSVEPIGLPVSLSLTTIVGWDHAWFCSVMA